MQTSAFLEVALVALVGVPVAAGTAVAAPTAKAGGRTSNSKTKAKPKVTRGAHKRSKIEPKAGPRPKAGHAPGTTLRDPSFEFRIVNWNAAGVDARWNLRDEGRVEAVADVIVAMAKSHDANVLMLQELHPMSLVHLDEKLPEAWDCQAEMFGFSLIATCVKGTAGPAKARKLEGKRYSPFVDWWGYLQVTYKGVLLTNVHTRGHWADAHVDELHQEIGSGIVAGDFNHTAPGWHQTEEKGTWTHEGSEGRRKIDHVLTVDPPTAASGLVGAKHGSNHRVVLAEVVVGASAAP